MGPMAETTLIAGRYQVLDSRVVGDREEMRARDCTLGREVTLVRCSEHPLVAGADGAARLREARALASLDHPGVQRLYDVLDEVPGPILVLEPVAGEMLATRLGQHEKLTPSEVRALGLELCNALGAIHAAGVVHRDVSASNVVIGVDGKARLVGFRLAKPFAPLAGTSIRYGSGSTGSDAADVRSLPTHPAPEQYRGESASPRTDLFALGCVLYRALTGCDAFAGSIDRTWVQPPDPRTFAPDAPRALAACLRACLAPSPVGRPQSAAELARALDDTKSPRVARARGWYATAALAVVASAGALLTFHYWPTPVDGDGPRGLGVLSAPTSIGSLRTGFEHSRALLIGIGGAYRANGFPPLTNAVADVEKLKDALEARPGDNWSVRMLTEEQATFDGIRSALAELENELGPEDRVFIFFAGHGESHPNSRSSGWLIPADAKPQRDDPARTNWLHFDTLLTFMKDAPAKHVLLAMDCCYGGRIAEMRALSGRAYEDRYTTQPARVVMAAGRADQQVQDSGADGAHSPFARVFLDALGELDSSFTSSQIHADLQRAFESEGLQQTPVLAHLPGASAGEFVFLAR